MLNNYILINEVYMKFLILLTTIFSIRVYAEDCTGIIPLQKINLRLVLTDNLTRRSYEEYVNKGWLDLGQNVYMQSAQGEVVNQMTRSTMNTLYNFHVMRLRDSLEPDYGSGVHIDTKSIRNSFNLCLSNEVKEKCGNELSYLLEKLGEFEKFQNLYMTKVRQMVSLIDHFNSGVQISGSAGLVYPATEAYNYVNNLSDNIKITSEFKGWVNILFREAENAVNEASKCENN